MSPIRRLARPMLAAVFISGGIDVLRDPGGRVEKAKAVTSKVAGPLGLPEDPAQLVKLNAAVQVGAGALLSIGRLPRLAAIALCGSIIPTTLAGHRFWEETEPATRAQQRIHFLKNLGLLGGLLLAAVDTAGAPSLSWRAQRAAKRAHRVAKTAGSHAPSLPGHGS
jgi:putative oxidoreductase